ncbi:DUF4160 domain-containing protein [Pseudomonas carnis]|jgi:hypothetical protein|uniref:DUF4160 domain-containing protein n=2 Tax=Pseudomonas TaxID=286 RepID=A0A109LKK1_PSEFL|nr:MULTISPECIES: DUF4160 domain-containing protein [Pseudomonas]KWV89085.1 hypothetical protein PFLmoz3_01984 [Pseudomonas fluorescens]MBA1252450.1 DUF4160 domain-containing protein [Pseudomonas carnis]MBA1268468.1 DUF4160 domain-containing protein [Pseudomonas carnis]MBJ2281980.1 DUF4160 domain-containing protein [Pseudomonas sp. MF6767]MBV2083223.1 DUF4160 domain-containing protein [Pseudomonas carnis]|tara:strand:+ start:193 stop:621 length:429 start_codon:yes stop_codon:yes gene_type:complete
MRVGAYKGYVISVFIRDEHCPPHVHVRGKGWDARFRFSFLDGEVELWDVEPERRRPPTALLKEIRVAIMQRHYLARARRIWWEKLQTVCLENHSWNWDAGELVPGLVIRHGVYVIASARHDVIAQRTILNLVRAPDCVGINL